MRHFFFYPVLGNPIAAFANLTGEKLGLSPQQIASNVLPARPDTEGVAEFAIRFPEDRRPLLMRYWQAQAAYYSPRIDDADRPAMPGNVAPASVALLRKTWRDFATSAICFDMASDDGGLLILFDDATVGPDGRLLWDGKSGDLPPRDGVPFPFSDAMPKAAIGDNFSIIWKALADQLKFIGIGMTLVGGPASIFTALFSFMSAFISPSNTTVDQILTGIKTLLAQNNIKIEIDFAQSAVATWAGWEHNFYSEADFKLLSDDSKKGTPPYTQALDRANIFIDKLHNDFLGTPRIFDAVNLMKGDASVDTNDLDNPSAAMLKFSSFLYFSGFVLTLGKQAWLYSQQVNGIDDQKTMDLANAVAGYSSQYTPYVSQMKAAIDSQIAQRTGMLSIAYDQGHPRWYIADSYKGGSEQGNWPQAWGFTGGWGIYTCCGTPDCNAKQHDAQNGLDQLINCYQTYFIKQIGPSKRDDLSAQVAQFVQNDADIQTLLKKNYPSGLSIAASINT